VHAARSRCTGLLSVLPYCGCAEFENPCPNEAGSDPDRLPSLPRIACSADKPRWGVAARTDAAANAPMPAPRKRTRFSTRAQARPTSRPPILLAAGKGSRRQLDRSSATRRFVDNQWQGFRVSGELRRRGSSSCSTAWRRLQPPELRNARAIPTAPARTPSAVPGRWGAERSGG
jgi:hypothetical protein